MRERKKKVKKERRGNMYASKKGILMRDGREIPWHEREEGREET